MLVEEKNSVNHGLSGCHFKGAPAATNSMSTSCARPDDALVTLD
jgi:hypothetical protein